MQGFRKYKKKYTFILKQQFGTKEESLFYSTLHKNYFSLSLYCVKPKAKTLALSVLAELQHHHHHHRQSRRHLRRRWILLTKQTSKLLFYLHSNDAHLWPINW